MPHLDLSTHVISYQTRGDGPAVLLLGGSGEPEFAWELCGLVDALVGAGFRAIWYSARGVAPSDFPPLPWSPSGMATDARALLDREGVDSCFAVGYSLGGFTLEALAREFPDRIRGAILMASAGSRNAIREAFIAGEVALGERHGSIPTEVFPPDDATDGTGRRPAHRPGDHTGVVGVAGAPGRSVGRTAWRAGPSPGGAALGRPGRQRWQPVAACSPCHLDPL